MLLNFEALEAVKNETNVETDDVKDKVYKVQTVEIEELFEDVIEDTVETADDEFFK
jgi:hypothetical protein